MKSLSQILKESITLDIKEGDTILMGKFLNKKTVVKSIGKDEHGMPTVNGKKLCKFRYLNVSESKDSNIDKDELITGTLVEFEHTKNKNEAKKIALDHLKENPKYYSKLYNAGLIDEPKAAKYAEEYLINKNN